MNKNKRQEENKLFGVFFTFPDVRRIGETTALLLDMLDSTVRIAFRKLREDEITTTETCQGEFTRLTKKTNETFGLSNQEVGGYVSRFPTNNKHNPL